MITVARADLLPLLAKTTKVVERRSTIPILQNIRLDAGDGRLTVTATDLDAQVTAACPCQADRTEAFTVPSALFHDAVRKLPEAASIAIDATDGAAAITSGRTRFRLPILPVGDFPTIETGAMQVVFTLDASQIDKVLARVSFAVSSEETRYYLNGIHLHQDEQQLVAVATDGHRLSRLTMPLPFGADGMPPIILPRKTLDIMKVLGGGQPIEIAVSASKVRFVTQDVTILSKLIDGTFPDYKRVVPSANPNSYTLSKAAIAAALERVTTISPGKGAAVRFSFSAEGLRLTATNPDTGTAEDWIDVGDVAGDPVETGFNGRYCLDMLAACPAETLTFQLGDPGSPARIEPVGEASTLFVIMPMRV